jgi:hypothetical protein
MDADEVANFERRFSLAFKFPEQGLAMYSM